MPEKLSSQSYKYENKGNSKIPIFQLFEQWIRWNLEVQPKLIFETVVIITWETSKNTNFQSFCELGTCLKYILRAHYDIHKKVKNPDPASLIHSHLK